MHLVIVVILQDNLLCGSERRENKIFGDRKIKTKILVLIINYYLFLYKNVPAGWGVDRVVNNSSLNSDYSQCIHINLEMVHTFKLNLYPNLKLEWLAILQQEDREVTWPKIKILPIQGLKL